MPCKCYPIGWFREYVSRLSLFSKQTAAKDRCFLNLQPTLLVNFFVYMRRSIVISVTAESFYKKSTGILYTIHVHCTIFCMNIYNSHHTLSSGINVHECLWYLIQKFFLHSIFRIPPLLPTQYLYLYEACSKTLFILSHSHFPSFYFLYQNTL